MVQITLPFSVEYQTEAPPTVQEVVSALQATDSLMRQTVELLPSLIDGLTIESSSLNVRKISQGSLKEIFGIALFVAFQDNLEAEVPKMLKDIFDISVSDDYDTIVTVVFLIVVFYGVSLAKDALAKRMENHRSRLMLGDLVAIAAAQTGKTPDEIQKVLEAKYQKPSTVAGLIASAKGFFVPSKRSSDAPILIDRGRLDRDLVRDVPILSDGGEVQDFARYKPYYGVDLELHAQDRDKTATGWAAVAPSVSPDRLKVRVMDPVTPGNLWQREKVRADIMVVEKITANGYKPTEIQIVAICSEPGAD
ncbi:hypothetical protein ACJMQP_26500 [Rhodopseudomonas palustris]